MTELKSSGPMVENAQCEYSSSIEQAIEMRKLPSPQVSQQRVLAVGPLPPPMTGTHVTFDIVCRKIHELIVPGSFDIIDTSQKALKKNSKVASWRNLRQAGRILRQYRNKLKDADRVLVFGSNGFLVSLAPILVWLAKRAGKPVCLRAFGGSLDRFLTGKNPLTRRVLQWTLRNVDGISVQTRLLQNSLQQLSGRPVAYTPGFRDLTSTVTFTREKNTSSSEPLRLVYVGLMRTDKGILVLLESTLR